MRYLSPRKKMVVVGVVCYVGLLIAPYLFWLGTGLPKAMTVTRQELADARKYVSARLTRSKIIADNITVLLLEATAMAGLLFVPASVVFALYQGVVALTTDHAADVPRKQQRTHRVRAVDQEPPMFISDPPKVVPPPPPPKTP